MIITALIFALCLFAALYLSRQKAKKQSVKRAAEAKRSVAVSTLLQNIEVYDGTPRGQKRLEDKI